jgi:hypothetical protein
MVMCHGMEYTQQVPAALAEMIESGSGIVGSNTNLARRSTGEETKKSKRARRQDIARRQRLVDQVSREAALKDVAAGSTNGEDTIDDLHDGASKIQSVFRRRQAGASFIEGSPPLSLFSSSFFSPSFLLL